MLYLAGELITSSMLDLSCVNSETETDYEKKGRQRAKKGRIMSSKVRTFRIDNVVWVEFRANGNRQINARGSLVPRSADDHFQTPDNMGLCPICGKGPRTPAA